MQAASGGALGAWNAPAEKNKFDRYKELTRVTQAQNAMFPATTNSVSYNAAMVKG